DGLSQVRFSGPVTRRQLWHQKKPSKAELSKAGKDLRNPKTPEKRRRRRRKSSRRVGRSRRSRDTQPRSAQAVAPDAYAPAPTPPLTDAATHLTAVSPSRPFADTNTRRCP